MAVGLSEALQWNLAGIETAAGAMKSDANEIEMQGKDLRTDAERSFEWMSGNTIETARESADTMVKRTFTLDDQLTEAADILSAFARNAAAPQQQLRTEVGVAVEMGATVAEDGTLTLPPNTHSSTIERLKTSAVIISSNLASLRTLDSDSAAALETLNGTLPDYSDNSDPTTMLVGLIHATTADSLAAGIDKFGDGSTLAKNSSRFMGPLGNLLALATGVAGASDDEPIGETLAAETAGLAAGALTTAATGAVIGSVFPGVGTVAGAGIGLVLGGAASLFTSGAVRDHFDDQR